MFIELFLDYREGLPLAVGASPERRGLTPPPPRALKREKQRRGRSVVTRAFKVTVPAAGQLPGTKGSSRDLPTCLQDSRRQLSPSFFTLYLHAVFFTRAPACPLGLFLGGVSPQGKSGAETMFVNDAHYRRLTFFGVPVTVTAIEACFGAPVNMSTFI